MLKKKFSIYAFFYVNWPSSAFEKLVEMYKNNKQPTF